MLKRNGLIVDVDGVSLISVAAAEGNYFVAVRHRNHLGVMSGKTIMLTAANAASFDFSDGLTGDNPTYSLTNALRVKNAQRTNIKSIYRAMWSGNTNPEAASAGKFVNAIGSGSDYVPILSRVGNTAFVDGYFTEDTNLNGRVQYIGSGNDKITVFTTALTSVIWEQLPENN